MVDQNDSFIREVNEELRSDQVRNAWKRYSRIISSAAVVHRPRRVLAVPLAPEAPRRQCG